MSFPSSAADSAGAYNAFASIYSQTMAQDFAHRFVPALRRVLLDSLPAGACILDLCCGSGQIAGMLTAFDFRVTGIDSSEHMLQLARAQAPAASFFCADATRFALLQRQEAVLCLFNSIAHFHTAEDLCSLFHAARNALRAGGAFLFDATSRERFARHWRGEFRLQAHGQLCTVSPHFDPVSEIARNDVTITSAGTTDTTDTISPDEVRAKLGDGSTRVQCLTIWQKCHRKNMLRHALAQCDFIGVQSFDAECDLGISGERGHLLFRATAG